MESSSAETTQSRNESEKFKAFVPDRQDTILADLNQDWTTALSAKCQFSADIYEGVMLNLILNPNIMSSYLFRADVYYDSQNDSSTLANDNANVLSSTYVEHMKIELRPRVLEIPGHTWQRTFVRKLIPRNIQLDADMTQTCHFFRRTGATLGQNTIVVVYIPHIENPEDMPWYHPTVKALAFSYTTAADESATISIHLSPFSSKPLECLQPRIDRTCLNLLQTIHKHGRGQQRGYQKRVHHDQVIPQQAFQETYAKLKQRHAKTLIADWVEQTDPTKHVFEDLGIAAFLIELWREMYGARPMFELEHNGAESQTPSKDTDEEPEEVLSGRKSSFPGFVDIGCGNGALVYILNSEGFQGWGFDARRRKTWDVFPAPIQGNLKELVLVPSVLSHSFVPSSSSPRQAPGTDASETLSERHIHPGVFDPGTFIVSNHADELTAWTPLLAHLSQSPFIAIPCCSHDLSGARFRAPPQSKRTRASATHKPHVLPQTPNKNSAPESDVRSIPIQLTSETDLHRKAEAKRSSQAAETGSLKKNDNATAGGKKKMPSAYATLCAYVASLARDVGFEPEKEMLRIPSTRNECILGRKRSQCGRVQVSDDVAQDVDIASDGRSDGHLPNLELLKMQDGARADDHDYDQRANEVASIVEMELGLSLDIVRRDWMARAKTIVGKKGEGH